LAGGSIETTRSVVSVRIEDCFPGEQVSRLMWGRDEGVVQSRCMSIMTRAVVSREREESWGQGYGLAGGIKEVMKYN
jgi:hypothetical protein